MTLTHLARRLLPAFALGFSACSGDDPLPTPTGGTSTPSADPTPRVLLLDVDGLHASDLERFIADNPSSALAGLAAAGTRYLGASASRPSDSFPGVLALMTGGTPASTGIYYDLSWDRTLSPKDSDCAELRAFENNSSDADADADLPNGGGGLDDSELPRDPANGCSAVYPHQYLKVNTAFEVVKSELGGRTAWSDKHLSYEVLQGPSGAGVDDLYDPEISADGVTDSLLSVEAYDDGKVAAILNEIAGKDSLGTSTEEIPTFFGMNFQALSVQQKDVGYLDASGTPSAEIADALLHIDASIAQILAALDDAGVRAATRVVVTSPHGQSPIDPTSLRIITPDVFGQIVDSVQPDLLDHFTGDDVGLLWLSDPSRTADVRAAIEADAAVAGVDHVLSGPELAAHYPDPHFDARAPDLLAVASPGVIYSDSPTRAEHGGLSADDLSVALLVSPAPSPGTTHADAVETRQVAPTILTFLGVDPNLLDAVRAEGTAPLPGLD
jgi:hypothetical protein